MANVLDRISIKGKLKFALLLTGLSTICCVFAGFFTYESITFKTLLKKDLATKAAIVAENCNAALAFHDSADAARVLRLLETQPRVISAAIYDRNGSLFASFVREQSGALIPPSPESEGSRFGEEALVLFRPISINGKSLGTLYLAEDLVARNERFWSFLEIASIVFVGSLVVVYAIGSRLARRISNPIVELTRTAREVVEREDYSLRVRTSSSDETGLLAGTLNSMLVKIQDRESALRQKNQDLQEAEKRYRTTLDHMLEGAQIIGRDWRYVYVNEVAARQGHKSIDEILGRTMMEAYPGIDEGAMFRELRRCMEKRTPVHMENEFPFADGTSSWFDLRFEPVPEGVFILSVDITREKQLAHELETYRDHLEELVKERTRQLEASNKELEAFSYSVSHDLRAPLRHINGFADLLAQHISHAADAKSSRFVRVISESAKEMGVLIDELLVFSRMGRAEMKRSPLRLSALVDEVILKFREEIAGRDIQWNVSPLPEVRGDPSMMRLVITNLIGNAVKYTSKKDQAHIEVGSTARNDEDVVFVRDNGAGFDMRFSDKLFGVFQRLHNVQDFEGTGIGLANVKRIINRHGGEVWAEGEVGKGAVFYFSLPKTTRE